MDIKRKNPLFPLSAVALACLFSFHAQAATDCGNTEEWSRDKAYATGDKAKQNQQVFVANWWSQGKEPLSFSNDYQEWTQTEQCGDGEITPPSNQAPTVQLDSPSASDALTEGDQITFQATAADEDGQIASVSFFVDGELLGSDTSAPYSFYWTAVEGSHTVVVKAMDDKQAVTETAPLQITVKAKTLEPENNAPTVTLSASALSVNQGAKVTLSSEASDTDGKITRVDFYVAGQKKGSVENAPFTFDWLADKAGTVQVYAKAFDDKGASSDSAVLSIKVTASPTVSNCRPEGLYQTPGVNVPYCTVYDAKGRENMGADHPRRIIGYFTSWRTGDDPQSSYLVKDIPWEQITHINYAFVSIGADGKVNIGDLKDPENQAVNKEWAGVDVDPALGFKGHFGALATYKKKHGVKTLFSIGGWAETGGHFDTEGNRVADGGFYTMTTNADGSINHAAIAKFAESAVEMMRKYQFDGIDIDYEYPTSMAGAGNPDDASIMEPRRPYLWASYQELMRVLREKIDLASAQDTHHYMLTIASPSSGYLLRGMETFDVTKYLDYVNIMSYDLHGAWNDHVGHNASLYDTGKDSELAAWDVYSTAEYGGIGYLNTDWAYHYFRGSMPAGRINIGVPYYSRGWQGVSGGENGLWGRAALPDQTQCQAGTGNSDKNKCGNGALGIDNMWHDKDNQGREMGAGSNPMWHAKNLENGIFGSYASAYQLDPSNPAHALKGTYTRHYDSVAVAPWLWNAEKKVFLSTEDVASISVKSDYVIDNEIGGLMIWELAGDYSCYLFDAQGKRTQTVDKTEKACTTGNGEYHMGNSMTQKVYEKFMSASPYGHTLSENAMPAEAVNITVKVGGFKVGDQNYPMNPKVTFTNHTGIDLPGGTAFQFDIPTSAPDNAKDQSGGGLSVIASGHSKPNNIGGLEGAMHRAGFSLPSWQTLKNGESYDLDMVYYLPISGPANYTVKINNLEYAFAFEYADLPLADLSTPTEPENCETDGLNVYPNWPQTDWEGKPSHANTGDKMVHEGRIYQANWYSTSIPGSDTSWTKVCG